MEGPARGVAFPPKRGPQRWPSPRPTPPGGWGASGAERETHTQRKRERREERRGESQPTEHARTAASWRTRPVQPRVQRRVRGLLVVEGDEERHHIGAE